MLYVTCPQASALLSSVSCSLAVFGPDEQFESHCPEENLRLFARVM